MAARAGTCWAGAIKIVRHRRHHRSTDRRRDACRRAREYSRSGSRPSRLLKKYADLRRGWLCRGVHAGMAQIDRPALIATTAPIAGSRANRAGRWGIVQADVVSCWHSEKLRQPHQIVSRGGKGEGPSGTLTPAQHRPAQAAGLDPAKRLLDPLAPALALGIAGMACGAPVNRRSAPAGILRHMRPHLHRAQLVDEVLRVPRVWPKASPRTGSPLSAPSVIARGRSARGSIM